MPIIRGARRIFPPSPHGRGLIRFVYLQAVLRDERNIRRRVYDVLNVMMSCDMIERDRTHIQWKGHPCPPMFRMKQLDMIANTYRMRVNRKRLLLQASIHSLFQDPSYTPAPFLP